MANSGFEAVVFDMDGVIFDSERATMECWIELANKYGIKDIETPYYKCTGVTEQRTRKIMLEAYGDDFPYDEYAKEASKMYHEKYDGGRLPIKSGVFELLDYLKKEKKKIALASSTRRQTVENQLRDAKLLDYFDELVTGDMVTKSKPDPEIFLLACEKLSVEPANAYAIEDSYNGIRSAFSGGLKPIMVPDLLPSNDEMKEKSEIVLDSLNDVVVYFKKQEAIRIHTVEMDDFSMNYFKFGSGDKAFVMLPGLSVQSVMGAAQAVADGFSMATDEYTIYVIDRRNELPDEYNIYEMAEDTAAVIKKLGLSDIYLFGASQGGMIAMTIAIEHPELVKKLALGSTSSHVTEAQYESLNKWIELAKKGDRKELYLCFGEMIYPPSVFDQFRDYFINVSQTVTDEELRRFIIIASGTKDFNVTDKLDRIQCPVLTTGTFEDQVLDSDATMEIAEKLDDKQGFHLYMYTGFGHASFDTAPDYRKRMLDFFAE